MKSVTIDIPLGGTQIEIHPRNQATQVVVVLPDDVELRVSSIAASGAQPSEKKSETTAKKSDLSTIAKRLRKLKVSTRAAAENSIKAMFQFEEPIGESECQQIFDRLLKQGLVKLNAKGKIEFPAMA
jgi:hypothetical protein